jgi:rhodanese-related sulfurtransferase
MLLGALAALSVLVVGCVGKASMPPPAQLLDINDQGIINVEPKEASSLIQANNNNPDFIIVDVRPSRYYERGYIEGAVNISLDIENPSIFQNKLNSLDKSKTYLTYCQDGCGEPAGIMEELNFKNIYDIEGGYSRWVEEGLPILE